MKMKHCVLDGPQEKVVVIPRGEITTTEMTEDGPVIKTKHNDAVFKARAVLDFGPFEKACPMPNPPMRTDPGGAAPYPWFEAPEYKKKVRELSAHRTNYIVIESLKATEDLEWETVTGDPATWGNYEAELLKAGFCDRDISEIISGVFEVNGFTKEKYAEAKNRFLLGQAVQAK